MTHEQANCFVAILGAAMVACGLTMALLAGETRLKGHGAKLGFAGLIVLVVAAIH